MPALLRRSGTVGDLPEPLKGGTLVEICKQTQVPTADRLSQWLMDRGLDTGDWGTGSTKPVKKLWQELADDESGLELWKKCDGSLQPVRVTHVLRAKVCSPDSYKRDVFLLNTWQQYGDGRKRMRNGLLSEKLTISEMPLEKNLKAVCERAVTQEEMQRLDETLFKISPGGPVPQYDPAYVCPITVVETNFNSHVIELEHSKSYPRLLTMYHLYTVDIVCNGLPKVDFTTLEFDHPDKEGRRDLKYVHAWVWAEWTMIQRYLFEGSSLRDRKGMGSFKDAAELKKWLRSFQLDLSCWGQKHFKTEFDLLNELESEEAHLELWGREDGVSLMMRVVHVVQLKVMSTDPRMKGKFLYNTWTQMLDGPSRSVNRLMSAKLSTHTIPMEMDQFIEAARNEVKREFAYQVDAFFKLESANPPDLQSLESNAATVEKVDFVDHRVDVVESPTFKGLCTLYHLYTCDVECNGLPLADFASLELPKGTQEPLLTARTVKGWCWVTWPQCLDMLHTRAGELEESLSASQQTWETGKKAIAGTDEALQKLSVNLQSLKKSSKLQNGLFGESEALLREIAQGQRELARLVEAQASANEHRGAHRQVPPSMVSEMAQSTILNTTADPACSSSDPQMMDTPREKSCSCGWWWS